MKKKILLIQSNYPGFLDYFYDKYPNWRKFSYQKTKNHWDKEWFGQCNFYSKYLNKFGWSAKEIIVNDFKMQTKWAKENDVEIRKTLGFINKRLPDSIKNFLGLQSWSKKIFWAQIDKFKPNVVYMHDLSILNNKDLRKLKTKTELVVGQIACPLPLNKKPLKEYDLIISSFPHYVKMFKKLGINSEYLRWCFEDSIGKKIKPKEKKYDVVFVGGFSLHHTSGNKLFEALAKKTQVDFWGYGVNMLSPNSPIRKNYHGEVWGKQMYEIFSEAKIVINRHVGVAKKIANNMRMFEATGMGCLLITDDKLNMSEFFNVNKEVVVYKDEKGLISKVKYYLKQNKKRENIARAGQKRTFKDHTYKIRMKELSKILNEYLDKK